MEDYEYFWLLEREVLRRENSGGATEQTREARAFAPVAGGSQPGSNPFHHRSESVVAASGAGGSNDRGVAAGAVAARRGATGQTAH